VHKFLDGYRADHLAVVEELAPALFRNGPRNVPEKTPTNILGGFNSLLPGEEETPL